MSESLSRSAVSLAQLGPGLPPTIRDLQEVVDSIQNQGGQRDVLPRGAHVQLLEVGRHASTRHDTSLSHSSFFLSSSLAARRSGVGCACAGNAPSRGTSSGVGTASDASRRRARIGSPPPPIGIPPDHRQSPSFSVGVVSSPSSRSSLSLLFACTMPSSDIALIIT